MIVTFIDISISPSVDAVSLLSILLKLALVFLVTVSFPPHSISVFFPLSKLPLIKTTIFPEVFSKTMKFAIFIMPLIKVSCDEFFSSLSCLNKADKGAFISACFCFSEHSETCGYSLDPLSNV